MQPKIQQTRTLMLTLMALGILGGCKPKTTAQKIEDKAEDAQHEMKQGMERAGENVERATDGK